MANGSANTRRFLVASLVSLLVGAGVAGYFYYFRHIVSTDDAYIDGRIFTITPRVAGYVTKIFVEDNQMVKAGQELVKLDPTEYEVALAEARANLAEAEYTLTSLELGVPLELTQTEHRVKGAEAELNSLSNNLAARHKEEEAAVQELKRVVAEKSKATLDLQRMTELRKSASISQSVLDDIETRYATANAQAAGAEAKLQSVRKQIAALSSDMERIEANINLAKTGEEQAAIRSKQVDAQKSRVDLANARLDQARLNLDYTTLVSPTNGYITRKKIEPGVMVSRGQALFAVVPMEMPNIWITANFKETQLSGVKPGQEVHVAIDTYSSVKIKGTVDSLMAGTGAVFSLFPPENATGNFVKIVQRIPVKIRIDDVEKVSCHCSELE